MLDLRRKEVAAPVRIVFEGEEIAALAGQSLAAALLAAGVRQFRPTPVSHNLPWEATESTRVAR